MSKNLLFIKDHALMDWIFRLLVWCGCDDKRINVTRSTQEKCPHLFIFYSKDNEGRVLKVPNVRMADLTQWDLDRIEDDIITHYRS